MKKGKSSARNSQTVKRGKATKPRASAGRSSGKAKPPLMQRLLAAQPLPPVVIYRAATVAILGLVALTGLWIANVTGVSAFVREEAVQAVGRAGFAVKRIEIAGANRIDRMRVYDIALEQQDRSMAAFDLAEVRDDLLKYGWVADARVSRRLPDTLVIDLVERTPVAVWQHGGKYALIDQSGVVLPGVDPASEPDLPVIAGAGAPEHISQLGRLLEGAPALKPQFAGATWIGNRRWDILFKSGETLSLPEDEQRASAAVVEFARLDGINRLLGRGIRKFDMRIPDRFVLRPGADGELTDLNLTTQGGDHSTRAVVVDDGV